MSRSNSMEVLELSLTIVEPSLISMKVVPTFLCQYMISHTTFLYHNNFLEDVIACVVYLVNRFL